MNKKKYVPPKVKPSKKKKTEPLPEWNSNLSDLSKFKLTPAEQLKKRINSISKNLQVVKKDLSLNHSKISNTSANVLEDKSTSIVNDNDDKMLSKSLNNDINNSAHFNLSKMNTHIRANSAIVHSRSKVSSTYSGIRTEISTMNFGNKPWNISLSQNKRNDSLKRLMKEYHEKKVSKIKLKIDKTEGNIDKKDWIIAGVNSKRKPRSVNYINEYEEFDEEDDKITQDPMVRITITKIEKSNQAKTHNRSTNSLIPDKLVTSENSWPTDALNQQIRNKNQKNMMKYNKDIDANSSNDEDPHIENKYNQNEYRNKENQILIENQENNLDTVNEEYKFLQDDLKRELSKLDGLEETMKKLNEILEFSEKSSMKFRFDQEQNDLGKYSELNHDNMGTTQSNHRNKNNFNSKSSNEKMNVNNYNNLNNLNTNESKTSNSKKVMDSRKETQKQNKVQVMQSSFPNHNTNESKASKKIDNENDYQANLSYVPISNKQNENLNLPNMNSVPSNNSNIEAPVINKEPDEINEISCIPNYNTNDTKLSKKNVPIDRNIINLDNGEKSLINQAQKNFDSHSNARYDNVDETSLNDLDYMKDLLMKTKNDLDKVATKFNTNSNLSSQMNFDDDEMEPRKLPNFLSNKFH